MAVPQYLLLDCLPEVRIVLAARPGDVGVLHAVWGDAEGFDEVGLATAGLRSLDEIRPAGEDTAQGPAPNVEFRISVRNVVETQ